MIDQKPYKELLERARKRYQQAVNAEVELRREFQLDMDFLCGEQWDAKVKRDREQGPSPRPCLVFNKVLPPVTQLGNQARQNKPAIKVNPVDSAGDPDTAKVIAGMIRHIEYDSDADQAYDTALFYAAGGGFGYWRYGCEESDPLSFDQDIKTIAVDDPLSIYLDCWARKADRSDAKWAFVLDRLPNDVHAARFGDDEADLSADFANELTSEGWRDADSKQVAEYWEVDSVTKTLRYRKDADGTVHPVYLEDLEPGELEAVDPETGEPQLQWVLDAKTGKPREGKKELPRVMQYIINGAAVLEEPVTWDGDSIPIVMITGLEVVHRGKRKMFSMTRFSRDPQQLLNFYKTMEAETISLAPKPKYVGATGQFKTKRRDWQRANTDNAAFLEYDPVAIGDKMAPEPQWRTFDPPVQALALGAAAAADDIKASTGYFDPSLGQVKGDQSGVAIGKLQQQGDVSNFHFMDNLARALKRAGRIIVQLIPFKYDTAREVRIVGEDQRQRVVKVNAPFIDENGKPQHYKLDLGKYDVTVQQGPSYSTQRQEVRDTLIQLAQGNPQVMALGGDIFFDNSDFPGADRLAKRWKKQLPPALQEDEDNPQADIPPQIQAQMNQLQQGAQLLQQQNQQLMDMLKTKILDLESRERIATQGNQAKIQVAETLAKSAAMNKQAELDHAAMEHVLDTRADLLNTQMSIASDASAQAMDHQQAQQAQASDQAHQQSMAAQAQAAQAPPGQPGGAQPQAAAAQPEGIAA